MFIYKADNYTLGTEIQFPGTGPPLSISEFCVEYRSSATDGARQLQVTTVASLAAIYALANLLKVKFYALLTQLDADSLTESNYVSTLSITSSNATSLASGYTLANELKTDFGSLLTKLDTNRGGSSTEYTSAHAISAANATTRATLITLLNELRTDFNGCLSRLDADPTVGFITYKDLFSITSTALKVAASIPASSTVAASKTMTMLFGVGFADQTLTNAILTHLATPIVVNPGESMECTDSANISTADRVTIYFEAEA